MYYPSLNNLYKTFEKVLKTSRFAIVPKSILLSKRSPQQGKNIYIKINENNNNNSNLYEVDQELGGGE